MSALTDGGVRRLAALYLDRALGTGSAGGADLAAERDRLDPRDRRLLQELVHGTLRWKTRLDHVLSVAANRPADRIEGQLLAPLRVAAYQLLFLDRVPGYAAVSEGVDEARRRAARSAGFVNAVLRRISRAPRLEEWPVGIVDPMERLAIETSHPRFLVERWTKAFGDKRAREILDANNRRPAYQLLSFGDRGGRDALALRLAREGVETRRLALSDLALEVTSGDPLATAAYDDGDFYIQDQASQAAALVPAPRPGEWVLDAAAAPGGKSFALLAAEPTVRVVAADVAPRRLATLRANRQRLSRSLPILLADAAAPGLGAHFDRVVVDLPCSGTGILARHPDLKWRLSESEIGRLAGEGLRLLKGALEAVRPGGLLVAITCSIEPDENERVIRQLLATTTDLAPAPLGELLEVSHAERLFAPGAWRLLPGADNDGFTVHALKKGDTIRNARRSKIA